MDPFVGKLGLFRVHQGTIRAGAQLFVGDGRKPVKVAHLFRMQGKEHAAALRDEVIAAWLPPITELCLAIGIPDDQAETHARLALGAARGLLLDVLVTGERTQVARAADLLNRLLLLSAGVGGAGA